MSTIKCSVLNKSIPYKFLMSHSEIKNLLNEKGNNFLDDKTFIVESLKLLGTMFDEIDSFDAKTEYVDVYIKFRNSVSEKYLSFFPDILDFSARLIIHEIYISHDDTTNINIEFDKINNASAVNRKHFEVAKSIAERIIKTYYFSQCKSKKIINYIDDFLPNNYTKNSDINKIVWYFIVCIVTFNKQVINNV